VWISQLTKFSDFELDELHHFINRRIPLDLRQNSYVCTMMSRIPRQIVAFNVDNFIESKTIQDMVDSVKIAERYYTDGGTTYLDVNFGTDRHIRNIENKDNTHNIESTNADLRHYIAGLARKNRCFFRKQENKISVLAVFIDAYNKFGEAKLKYRKPVTHKSPNPTKHLHKWKYPAFSILDYL
jgi:IS1 family transposase